jgi:hypothetical protein
VRLRRSCGLRRIRDVVARARLDATGGVGVERQHDQQRQRIDGFCTAPSLDPALRVATSVLHAQDRPHRTSVTGLHRRTQRRRVWTCSREHDLLRAALHARDDGALTRTARRSFDTEPDARALGW